MIRRDATYVLAEYAAGRRDFSGLDLSSADLCVEPTDAEVEAGARAVDPAAWEESQWQVGGRENVLPESEGARAARDEARGLARAVLVAAREARTT